MNAPCFILPHLKWPATQVVLTGDDLAHCRSLRLKPKDKVLIGDGRGRLLQGALLSLDARQARIELLDEIFPHTESPLQITLYQGLTKGSKLELVIQKATELGVSRVVPLISAFSQIKIHEQRLHKHQRYLEIARQACQQSGRVKIPGINQPLSMTEALQMSMSHELALLFHQDQVRQSLPWPAVKAAWPKLGSVGLFVGPEGGFEHDEVNSARAAGIQIVTLGRRILRAETAGMVAVALAQAAWGDVGGTEDKE